MMRAPAFWSRTPPSALARFMSPLGAVVGAIAARRMARAGYRAAAPVLCVGNLVAGGAGKTPTALAIATMLRGQGHSPVFLSRGYGGRLEGPVQVAGHHVAADVGDEPLLLAQVAPVVVARDRVAGARLAVAHGATAILMDDGFQNPSLHKDISFLVVDGAVGIGNGMCLPAGPLRAPVSVQFAHARAVVLIGSGEPGVSVAAAAAAAGLPVLHARLVADPAAASRLAGHRLLGFTGIGRPRKFADSLVEAGVEVSDLVEFPDHHPFSEDDARDLLAQADRDGVGLVTTEKDRARLNGAHGTAQRALASRTEVLPVTLVFEDETGLSALIAETVR